MPAKEDSQSDEESGPRSIQDTLEYHCPAVLAICCFPPLGFFALFFSHKTRVYKEENEHEKAKVASDRTLVLALTSLIVGLFIPLLFLYRIFFF